MGGIPIMMHHLSNALVECNVEVLVAPPPLDGDAEFTQKYRIASGSRKDWERGQWLLRPFREARYRRQISRLIEDFVPDALLLGDQAYTGQYAEAALWAGRHYNIPTGAFCHGLDVLRKLKAPPPKYRLIIRELLGPLSGRSSYQRVQSLLRSADCVFANSTYTAKLVKKLANRGAVVTGCGLADQDWQREMQLTPAFEPELKKQRKIELGLTKDPLVVFIGRLVPRKNVGLMLKAMAEIKSAQLVVIGDGPLKTDLQEQSRSLGINERVTWAGRANEKEKWKILRASDVLCLPATEGSNGDVEGFGIVLLEAAAAATPAVAADSGGMPDVVEDEGTGLLWQGEDPADLAAKLRQLITDAALAKKCVTEARNRIRQEYNWPQVAQKVIQAIQGAIGNERASS